MKTVKAYKLFVQRDGALYPLFIGKKTPTPVGTWIKARFIPTDGYAHRPGWHAGILPLAPHLRTKLGKRASNRVWAEVELPADDYYLFRTSKMQGGAWLIGGAIRIRRVLSDHQIATILTKAGHADQIAAETL
jgi:hypothetical protein